MTRESAQPEDAAEAILLYRFFRQRVETLPEDTADRSHVERVLRDAEALGLGNGA